MGQPGPAWLLPRANSSDGLQVEGARALAKNPQSGHRFYKDSFIGHTGFCLAQRDPGPKPHHFCLHGSGFFSLLFFFLLVPLKEWELEGVPLFFLEFTRFSFYFPKGRVWSNFSLGAVCCP